MVAPPWLGIDGCRDGTHSRTSGRAGPDLAIEPGPLGGCDPSFPAAVGTGDLFTALFAAALVERLPTAAALGRAVSASMAFSRKLSAAVL